MACGGCGKSQVRHNPKTDKRGNSLNKYGYLKPNQLEILKAEQEKKDKENK